MWLHKAILLALMEGTLMEYVVAKTKAVSIKLSTYPKKIMHNLGFYIGDIQNTRVRL
jgi:hypothetical protein